jgi:conjugative relaxase-like TrwC/TraI family protein
MAVEQIRPVRDPNYYLAEPTLNAPTFRGNGARLLGIEGETVTPHAFTSLFAGYTPEGVRLPKYMHRDRRGAFEVTVNLTKCGSIMGMLAGDSRVQGVLEGVGEQVAGYIEKNARVRVTKRSEVEKSKAKMPKGWKYPERKPENLVWAGFVHPTSREGDPHLHLHLVFYNLSLDRQEGTWKAIETRYIDQPQMGELARKATIKGLRQLGYKVRSDGKQFEIVGVPAEVKAEFSRRHKQIREIESEYQQRAGGKAMSSKERSKLSLYRRPSKAVVDLRQRHKQWLSRLSPDQFRRLTNLVKAAREAVRSARMRRNLSRQLDFTRQMVQTSEMGHERQR